MPSRCRLTTRLYEQVGAAVADGYSCVTSAARSHGVSWPVAHDAFIAHVTPTLEQELPQVAVLGQRAAGLAHEPDRGDVGAGALVGTDQPRRGRQAGRQGMLRVEVHLLIVSKIPDGGDSGRYYGP